MSKKQRKSEGKSICDFPSLCIPIVLLFSDFALGETLLFVGKVERVSVLRLPLRRGKFFFRKLLFGRLVFVPLQIYVCRIYLESTFITFFVDEADFADRYSAVKRKTNVNARTLTRIIPVVDYFEPTRVRRFATFLFVFEFVFDLVITVCRVQIRRRRISVDSQIDRLYAFVETVYANPYLFICLSVFLVTLKPTR